jgi:hypothetical protein
MGKGLWIACLLLLAGCYEANGVGDCEVACGEAGLCPKGLFCSNGRCAAEGAECAPPSPIGATADAARAGRCSVDDDPCDDGNPCTSGDRCRGGECAGLPYTCNDNDACTDDVCDGAGGCENTNVAAPVEVLVIGTFACGGCPACSTPTEVATQCPMGTTRCDLVPPAMCDCYFIEPCATVCGCGPNWRVTYTFQEWCRAPELLP